MRHLPRFAVLVVAVVGSLFCASTQAQTPVGTSSGGFIPVPTTAKTEGLPPIPTSIADALAPYTRFTSALLLGWHPTERKLLVQAPAGNVQQIQLADGPGAALKPLTTFEEGVLRVFPGDAVYEPQGAYFVFRKDIGSGSEKTQLFRYDAATGKPTLLTDGESRNGTPVRAHKSALVAYNSSKVGSPNRDLYVLDPATPGSARRVLEVQGNWDVFDWSADDSEILAYQAISTTEHIVWRVNVKTGAKTQVSPSGEKAAWVSAQYTPDGRFLFAVTDRGSEFRRVWRQDVASGNWTPVTAEGDAVEAAVVSPDGRTLAVVFNRDASSRLELWDADKLTARFKPAIPTGQLVGFTPLWNRDGSEVALTIRSVRTNGDVFSASAKTGEVVRWTTSAIGGVKPEDLPDAEVVHWKSFDGRMISGVLYRPPARFTGPRPIIVNIHGGPQSVERPRFQGRSAYFLNELGVAIVFPNYRGSSGLGRTFEKLDDGVLREGAVKDIGALLDWLALQPWADKNRVLVTGASYGGFLTYAVAEAYGDRIRCAIAGSGIANFITYFENTDPARLADRRAEYGDERDPAVRTFLTEISPVTHADRLRTPLMIEHGGQDSRVPVAQVEEMARGARARGVPVWTIVFEDEGHDPFPSKAPNNNFHFYAWVLFAQKYLLN